MSVMMPLTFAAVPLVFGGSCGPPSAVALTKPKKTWGPGRPN